MNPTVLRAAYVKSIDGTDPIIHDPRPKVTFLGRSNVGKSSLINSLTGKKIAYSSTRPGKTTKLDFFLVEDKLYFVDLPGYGYARRSKEDQEHYRKLIAWYLFRSGVTHKLAILIIDPAVGITDYDRESITLLTDAGIPFVVVANKSDKLKMKDRARVLTGLREEAAGFPLIVYSSKTLEGRDELLRVVLSS